MPLEEVFLSIFGLVRPLVRESSILFNDPFFVVLFSFCLVIATSILFQEQRKLPFLAGAVLIALLLGIGFKSFLQEERPCANAPSKIDCPTDFSLPSMHALGAFTLCIIAIGNRSFPIYLIYALFIAFSRVYLGVHTITEVAAGLSLAFFACVLAELCFRLMRLEVPQAVHIRHDIGRLPHSFGKSPIDR
ncbi:TPA: phosphatase PAP2 family protein [Candidatus Micrarchaeota archaeon]|nr:phosphatase PAP2 family protein [Candidatus Micrarchaeota archaeon]HIH30937.1 phosphatase PAP2 family protein [Candidatus Micrarchaeota archaeon]